MERSNYNCYVYIFFPDDFMVSDNIEFLRIFKTAFDMEYL